jgi:hypothetical protein
MSTTPTPVFVEYRTPSYFTYLDWLGYLTSADYRRRWYSAWREKSDEGRKLGPCPVAKCHLDQHYLTWNRCWVDYGLNTPANIEVIVGVLREVANRHGHDPDSKYAGDQTLVLNGLLDEAKVRRIWEVLPSKDSSGGIMRMDRMVSVLVWKYTVARQRAKAVESVVGAKPSRQTNKRGTAVRVVTVKLDESLIDPDVGITEQITAALRAYRGVSAPEHQTKVVMAPDGLLARLAAQKAQKDT